MIIGLLAAALVAAAVWFFVLRGKAEKKIEAPTPLRSAAWPKPVKPVCAKTRRACSTS